MNNELIERIDKEIQNLMGQRDTIERLLPNNTAVRELTQIIKVLKDCKAALSEQAEPVSVPQNVEEFIAATGFETSHKSGKLIRADHLRAWMAGHARAPVEATQEIIMAMGESQAVDDEGIFPCLSDLLDFSGSNKTRVVLIAAYNAMLTASKESGK